MFFLIFILVAVAAFVSWRTMRVNPNTAGSANISMMVAVGAGLVALSNCFTVIPAGSVGVVDFFGTVSDNTLKSGINFVNPLARIIKMSIKTQEIKEVMDVPSKEGLTVQLEVSLLYHLNPEKAADVYKTVGEEYESIIIEPQFRSVTRGVTASFEAKALYTSEREHLSQLLQNEIVKATSERGITVESAPLRRVTLPAGLSASIEQKLQSEQESQRMQFVLTKEKQEADRKRIEAQGISDFQKIVNQGLNSQLLTWKGIEATEKLANSPNTKVIIVGGKDGLPLILDTK
ncbi:MAG: prohibitin family protein [Bacteriovoracaceae bacterium]|nr:prohibitin family protein [Bacteroidota bacterium]